MDIQTFYPVFESGQVLTSQRLNEIIDYLEPQDRISRSHLTGIGILCGLQPDWNPASRRLGLSRGVAVTSEGYLLIEDAGLFDRVRPYRVPVPSGDGVSNADKARARYPFLFDGQNQRSAFELLPTDFVPAAGEAPPTALTDSFVADKTLLLFLEINTRALKRCDMNDCSDKGSQRSLVLRRLLISRDDADLILKQEQTIAKRPVDRASHPRLGLATLEMEKVNPAGSGVDSLFELYGRYIDCVQDGISALQPALQAAWKAYQPLLESLYPDSQFPQGPVPPQLFVNMLGCLARNPLLLQYQYAAVHDLQLGYNEFIDKAALFDGECAPDPRRFPQHVLCGDVVDRPVSFSKAPKTLAEFASYDPMAVEGGPLPDSVPAARRHHFVPSPALDAGYDKAAELRSLFARLVLQAQTFSDRDLLHASIELTPSQAGKALLGERAIPFYYRFKSTGDLFANWSWMKSRSHQLASVHSWQFTAAADPHPFLLRQDAQDFIRIEGCLGKPLGSAMAELISEKRRLGLSFSIQPVWLPLTEDDSQGSEARQQALAAIRQLMMCRMRDLDVIFLILMAVLFAFMVWLVRLLGKLNATQAIADPTHATTAPAGTAAVEAVPAGLRINSNNTVEMAILALEPQEAKVKLLSTQLLTLAREERSFSSNTLKLIAETDQQQPLTKESVASIYDKVRDNSIGGELFERVSSATATLGIAGDRDSLTHTVYPSIALMARAEEMMKVSSVSSLADFDADRFDTAMRGFTDAYTTYASKAQTNSAKIGAEAAAANQAIIDRQSLVSAAGSQVSSGALASELTRRLKAMFAELTLPGYAAKHPGLEHQGGVPVGGTFVLLYTGRDQILEQLAKQVGNLREEMGELFQKLLKMQAPAPDIQGVLKELRASSRPQSKDLLDNFVVLGDFCLPYLCCDGECTDAVVDRRINQGKEVLSEKVEVVTHRVQPEQPTQPEQPAQPAQPSQPVVTDNVIPVVERPQPEPVPTTGKVNILISGGSTSSITNRLSPISRGTLTITDLSNNSATRQRLTAAKMSIDLKPGKYALVAATTAGQSNRAVIAVKAGSTQSVTLKIAG